MTVRKELLKAMAHQTRRAKYRGDKELLEDLDRMTNTSLALGAGAAGVGAIGYIDATTPGGLAYEHLKKAKKKSASRQNRK